MISSLDGRFGLGKGIGKQEVGAEKGRQDTGNGMEDLGRNFLDSILKMEKAKTFEDVIVWQKAHSFVLKVYQLTKSFPPEEKFGLTQQFRRAAVSVPANFAEGFRKWGNRDQIRFINIAQGSLEECRYYTILSRDLGLIKNYPEFIQQLDEVGRLLYGYSKAIQRNN